MKSIEEYIQEAASMKNTSDGGSPAYHFEDVCLIKYRMPIRFGSARESAEVIAQIANEKNAKGVRTPAHLGVKRVIEGEEEICWVLQERAKGVSFANYSENRDINVQIEKQLAVANIPEKHYEKLVSDVCELFNLGLELKPKNLFYDENIQDGGFTIIDLLCVEGEPFDPDSLKDVLQIYPMLSTIYGRTGINKYRNGVTENDVTISNQQRFKIMHKIFMGMEKSIPNFEQHRRWVLRTLDEETLEFFEKNGTIVGDLTLNVQEQKHFNEIIENIVANSIQKVENGTHEIWQIFANEITKDLEDLGMKYAWLYHEANDMKPDDFYDRDEYIRKCFYKLKSLVEQKFEEQFDALVNGSTNPNILKAKAELDKIREEEQRRLAKMKKLQDTINIASQLSEAINVTEERIDSIPKNEPQRSTHDIQE